jgi:hypothetical protein
MRDHPSPAKHRLERVGGETLIFALLGEKAANKY